jgi:hypothetical protein
MPNSKSGASTNVTMTCLIHCDLHVKVKEQQEREIGCGNVVPQPPKIAFLCLSKA